MSTPETLFGSPIVYMDEKIATGPIELGNPPISIPMMLIREGDRWHLKPSRDLTKEEAKALKDAFDYREAEAEEQAS